MRRSPLYLLIGLALVLEPSRTAAQAHLPEGFALQSVVLDPFDSPPVGFAFLPDGRIFVIEKDTGQVRLATPGATSSVVVTTIPGITTELERGLLGVAVDPAWPARPYVYFLYDAAGSVSKITMYAASGDLEDPQSTNLTLGSPYVLLSDIPDTRPTHNGGTLHFGPDGNLYASLGEDARACEAQNLALPLGKILRLDVSAMPGSGSGPPAKATITPATNPFAGGEWERLVYAYGLRNPFRFTIDPEDGNLYIGDVGLSTWEEIDELTSAGYTGNNYGWPEYEGPLQDPDPIFADCSTPPFVEPIYVYPNPPGSPPAAIICGPRYRTSASAPYGFPRAYGGDLFLADFYGGWIRRLERHGITWSVADSAPGQPSALQWAGDLAQIADLQQGPDGALYVMSFVSGGVPRGLHRIVNTLASDSDARAQPSASRVRVLPTPATVGAGVRLEFRLARPEAAAVRIYDLAGRLVRTLWREPAASGALYWDGRTQNGRRVVPGLYLFDFRAQSGERLRGRILFAS